MGGDRSSQDSVIGMLSQSFHHRPQNEASVKRSIELIGTRSGVLSETNHKVAPNGGAMASALRQSQHFGAQTKAARYNTVAGNGKVETPV